MKKRTRKFLQEMQHVKIEFNNRGAQCPLCKFVFKNGFSDVTGAMARTMGDRSAPDGAKGPMTLCTGCFEPLRMVNGTLVAVPAFEQLLFSETERECLSHLRLVLMGYKISFN
jgi:hypothetical protein